MQTWIGIAGDDERIDLVAPRHQPPQGQGDALDVLLRLDAVGALLQRHAVDFRPILEGDGRERIGEALGHDLVGVGVHHQDAAAGARSHAGILLDFPPLLRDARAPSSAKPRASQEGVSDATSRVRLRHTRQAMSGPPSMSSTPTSASRTASIAAIGRNLPAGATEIDAKDRLVLPGGIDAHAHIEQLSAAGIVNADTFESATTSAAFGGTTTRHLLCRPAPRHEPDDRGRRLHGARQEGRGHRLHLPHDPHRSDEGHARRSTCRRWSPRATRRSRCS